MKNTLHIKSIDQVIEALEYIIDISEQNSDTGGYFAALYHKVTVQVKQGITSNFFDDGARMEALAVVFAKRYVDAWIARQNGNPVTNSWRAAFDISGQFRPVVMQHLLLGMNAHINLDLGISAAQIMRGENMAALHRDFNKINSVLSSLVHEVQKNLSSIWPTLTKLLRMSGKADDFMIDFSMKLARDGAWKFANELAAAEPENYASVINMRDERVTEKVGLVISPGLIPSVIFLMIRLGERGSVTDKIKELRKKIA